MKQLLNFADERHIARCVYCAGGANETREHVPSKVLIDKPFPENLPIVPACQPCNSSFSLDEEYLACLIDCTLAGSTDPDHVTRENVRRILLKNSRLRAKLSAAKTENNGVIVFKADMQRVLTVVLKLARGHAAFELSEPQFEMPASISAIPLLSMSVEGRDVFELSPATAGWPEVGSRAMQRLAGGYDLNAKGWIVVQEGRYRFIASTDDGICIRMVLSEYLACEVVWSD